MFSLPLVALALSATFGVIPPAVSGAVASPTDSTLAADTTQLPLTVAALEHMAAFWTKFLKQPDSVTDAGQQANQEPLAIVISGIPGVARQTVRIPSVVNMVAMAKKFPSVAADLKRAGLTPREWERYRRSLFVAKLADETAQDSGVSSNPTPSVVWQNVMFLRTYWKQFNDLRETGMWFPVVTRGGPTDVDRPAPQFAVRHWVNDSTSSFRTSFGDGHVYVLDFTAHWCGPCQHLYSVVESLQTKFAPAGVRFRYMTLIFGYYDETQGITPAAEIDSLKHYVVEHHLTAPMAVIEETDLTRYFPGGGINFPHLVVIDGSGKVRAIYGGESPEELSALLTDELTKLTQQSPAPSK